MLTAISVSDASRSASSRPSGPGMGLSEVVELLLEELDHLRVAGAPIAPAPEDVVPAAGIVEVPVFCLSVEGAGEGVVEHPGALALWTFAVRGHPDSDPFHVGNHQRHPPLAELVVGLALEAVLEPGRRT